MSLHLAPLMLHARGYPDSVDVERPLHKMHEKYRYHIVVLINDLGVARLEGLDDRITHRDRREMQRKLRAFGVIRAEWRHNGIEKHSNLVKRNGLQRTYDSP